MTKHQIRYLKMLGYTDTAEDGAILEYPTMLANDGYVWKGQTFEEVMRAFPLNLRAAICTRIGHEIIRQEVIQ